MIVLVPDGSLEKSAPEDHVAQPHLSIASPAPAVDDDDDELSRFAHGVQRALSGTSLTWEERAQVRRDLGFLLVEARHSARPELLDFLIQGVCEALVRGGMTSETSAWLRKVRPYPRLG